MEAKYLVKEGDKIIKHGEISEKLFEELTKSGIKRAIFLGQEILYFELHEDKAILTSVERKYAGFAKIFAKKMLERKKVNLASIEEAFEFAKKVERASLEELAKLR